ncbi:MAG: hypothetical protein KME07_17535 [Pegethrix bostrychoides GSE-TBD4-15B]|jgi:hypothetical protein|uniref:Lipoprotein n=1 Tax=Pegethrix bostrychoides GSE-TBD4-15B TaxID=2839662 RepID=A0A951PCR0_9CYAN|nr:hypothetical protein [Pegethrix bostrychoides GSE-TBD4-15B]
MTQKSWMTSGLAIALLTLGALAGCSSQPTAQKPDAKPAVESAAEPAGESDSADAAKGTSRPVENVTLAPGNDPLAMVLATRQPNTEGVGSEQFKLNYAAPDKAIVVVTKTGLADDSMAAIRTRYEFAATGTEGAKWQLTQVSEQNKCRVDRGSRDWTSDLCK